MIASASTDSCLARYVRRLMLRRRDMFCSDGFVRELSKQVRSIVGD